ncbi:hypothetical protein ACWEIJ_17325 [Lentzea sp. NPDC004789]
MQDDPHQPDHSIRDGIFDGSADDLQDLSYHGFDDGFPRSRRRHRYGHHDLSGAPPWVKVFVWTGALLAIAGLGVLMFGVLSPPDPPDPFSSRLTDFPTTGQLTPPSVGGPNLPLGFGLFFAGFVLTAIGALGHSTSKRR